MVKMRSYTQSEKDQILQDVANTGNVAEVARKNNIPTGTIHTWLHKAKPSVKAKEKKIKDTRHLEKQLADIKLENQILKELLKKTYQLW